MRCGTCSPHNKPCFVCGCSDKARQKKSPQQAVEELRIQDFEARKKDAIERFRRRRRGSKN